MFILFFSDFSDFSDFCFSHSLFDKPGELTQDQCSRNVHRVLALMPHQKRQVKPGGYRCFYDLYLYCEICVYVYREAFVI